MGYLLLNCSYAYENLSNARCFDENIYFLKILIFDVNTAIRNFSKFPNFLQIFDLYQDFEILHIDTCKLIFQKLGIIRFHLKKQACNIKIPKVIKVSVSAIYRSKSSRRDAKIGVYDVIDVKIFGGVNFFSTFFPVKFCFTPP